GWLRALACAQCPAQIVNSHAIGSGPRRARAWATLLDATVGELLGSARSSLHTTSWIDDLLGRQPATADGGRAGRLECLHDPFGIDVAAQSLDLVRADAG